MIKYLQLQQRFDVEKMQAEIAKLESGFWKSHYNTKHYDGDWNILPLRSVNGDVDHIIANHSGAGNMVPTYKNTGLLQECDYIRSVLDFFECEKTTVRLMKLGAGAIIKEHSDHALSFEDGEVRLHIPVQTNATVEFYLDDERVMMQEGECWYLNLSLKHRINNFGSEDRIHLVIDCKVNDWIKEQFAHQSQNKKEMNAEREEEYKTEDKLKIIAQLRSMNTETALQLADKMEKEL